MYRYINLAEEKTILNLLIIFANEALSIKEKHTAFIQGKPVMWFKIHNRKIYINNPKITNNGIILEAESADVQKFIFFKEKMNYHHAISLLEVNKVGEKWLRKNILTLSKKLQVDNQSNKILWSKLLDDTKNSKITKAYLMSIVEQYNPCFERNYHPLPHLQEGNLKYSGYFSKKYSPHPKNPLVGSYNLYESKYRLQCKIDASSFNREKILQNQKLTIHPQNTIVVQKNLDLQESTNSFIPLATIRSGFLLNDGNSLTDDTSQIKLDYLPKVTSRSRAIPLIEHLHAIQMNNLLKGLIDNNKVNNIGIVPDLYSVFHAGNPNLSFRIRGSLNSFYPSIAESSIVFPSFGYYYFSNSVPYPLIKELIDRSKLDPIMFLHKNVLRPVLHTYFTLAIKYGLIHESHGQNILIEYDLKNNCTKKVILRDLESIALNQAMISEYNEFFDPSIYTDGSSLVIDPLRCKEKISQRLHHWVIKVHLEPILFTISHFYKIPLSELYISIRNEINGWWIENEIPYRIQEDLVCDKQYLRNYLYTNKILSADIPAYNTYCKPLYLP